MPKLVLITGAPCSGKTETMELLQKLKGFNSGSKIYLVPEAPTYLCGGERPLHSKPSPSDLEAVKIFDQLVYYSRTLSCIQAREKTEYDYVLFDRGTLDGVYYSPELLNFVGSSIDEELARYDAVVLMETLVHSGEYSSENNLIRTETAEEAVNIEKNLVSLYGSHPKFFRVYSKHNNLKRASIVLKFLETLKGQNGN